MSQIFLSTDEQETELARTLKLFQDMIVLTDSTSFTTSSVLQLAGKQIDTESRTGNKDTLSERTKSGEYMQ